MKVVLEKGYRDRGRWCLRQVIETEMEVMLETGTESEMKTGKMLRLSPLCPQLLH